MSSLNTAERRRVLSMLAAMRRTARYRYRWAEVRMRVVQP